MTLRGSASFGGSGVAGEAATWRALNKRSRQIAGQMGSGNVIGDIGALNLGSHRVELRASNSKIQPREWPFQAAYAPRLRNQYWRPRWLGPDREYILNIPNRQNISIFIGCNQAQAADAPSDPAGVPSNCWRSNQRYFVMRYQAAVSRECRHLNARDVKLIMLQSMNKENKYWAR